MEDQATQTTQTEQVENEKSVLFDDSDIEEESTDQQEQPEQPEQASPEALKVEDITIPEGMEYDAEIGNSFIAVGNEYKIPKEAMQKMFDIYHGQNAKFLASLSVAEKERAKKFMEDIKQEKADWEKLCVSDTEYGGQKWEASQAVINRGCEHLATPEAVKLMQAYNLNYHPEIVRMFYRAGLLVSEDKSNVSGNGAGNKTDPAMAIFGESLKEYHKRREEIK